jgi:hypothetical protein
VGHESWREIALNLPLTGEISGLRIDFYSPLTKISISRIECEDLNGARVYQAKDAESFAKIRVEGDALRRGLDPLTIEVTGVDPQLHLPAFTPPMRIAAVRMRLCVEARPG